MAIPVLKAEVSISMVHGESPWYVVSCIMPTGNGNIQKRENAARGRRNTSHVSVIMVA